MLPITLISGKFQIDRDGKDVNARGRVIKLSNAIWEDEDSNPIIGTELVVNNTSASLRLASCEPPLLQRKSPLLFIIDTRTCLALYQL